MVVGFYKGDERVILRPLLVLALTLTALLFGAMSMVHALPRGNPNLAAFFTPTDDCVLPCWFGIRPGETRFEEALALLRAHPWVNPASIYADINITEEVAIIRWRWNGRQPWFIDVDEPVSMPAMAVIRSITIPTTLSMGDLQAFYGEPERGMIARAAQHVNSLVHYAVYGGLSARSLVTCPVSRSRVWNTSIEITLSPEVTAAAFRSYDLSAWLRRSHCDP